jgi:hypothetical protein
MKVHFITCGKEGKQDTVIFSFTGALCVALYRGGNYEGIALQLEEPQYLNRFHLIELSCILSGEADSTTSFFTTAGKYTLNCDPLP